MKKIKHIFIAILMTTLSSITLEAQVRPDIFSFSSSQREELADLIIDFVDVEIIQIHCDYTTHMGVSYDIHDNFNFFTFS